MKNGIHFTVNISHLSNDVILVDFTAQRIL